MEKFRIYDPLSFVRAPVRSSNRGVGYISIKNVDDNKVGIFICDELGQEVGGCNICTLHPSGRIEVHSSINPSVALPDLTRHRAFAVRENR